MDRNDLDKNRTETPPPSYDEALAISSNGDNLYVALPDGATAVAASEEVTYSVSADSQRTHV